MVIRSLDCLCISSVNACNRRNKIHQLVSEVVIKLPVPWGIKGREGQKVSSQPNLANAAEA